MPSVQTRTFEDRTREEDWGLEDELLREKFCAYAELLEQLRTVPIKTRPEKMGWGD